ncbi:superantigen-like protein SSL4 [Microbacterium gorillae]|uniref:hypothetical protein n=1 Tax=Microbacterium gorillae TaxID=1231063 RepID=UPI00058C4DE4|nr:hypothetical protein [Microbacterium gorillae]
MNRTPRVTAALAVALLVPVIVGGTAAPTAIGPRPTEFCWKSLILQPCDEDPHPDPAPTAAQSPTPTTAATLGPIEPEPIEVPEPTPTSAPAPAPEPTTSPAEPVDDPEAPVFTTPPAQMGSGGMSFRGLRGIALVNVPLDDGTTVPALRIEAKEISITGFSLTVRQAQGPALVTTADRMTLSGNVRVYIGSITATLGDGASYTFGADTPAPLPDLSGGLITVTMGLLGSFADGIAYENIDQGMRE